MKDQVLLMNGSHLSILKPLERAGDERQAEEVHASVAGGAICCAGVSLSRQLTVAEAEQAATLFKALGNPVRLQMVELLSRYGGQVCVCDIERQFALSQPTISHHLKVLRQAGVVDCEQKGLWVYYYLRTEAIDALRGLLDALSANVVRT